MRAGGRHAATPRSDVYSLCASLADLFREREDETSRQVVEVLGGGRADAPEARSDLEDLETALAELLGETPPPPAPPPARFWTEDQIVPFNGRDYRVVGRLGSGGVGTAFKVVEIDRATKEDLGTYVAKVAHDEETGRRTVGAYSLARSHLQHQAVSGIFEVAREWRENAFTALMTWVDGAPLSDFTGVFPLLAEEQGEESGEALAVRWLGTMCEALDVLHRNGLVHGDVSPRNMIVSGNDLVLTDYDFVRKVGEDGAAPGTVLYCAPSSGTGPAAPADDVYALAAGFFHVLFGREPFRYDPLRGPVLDFDDPDARRADGDEVDFVRLQPVVDRERQIRQEDPDVVAERRPEAAPDVLERLALAVVGERSARKISDVHCRCVVAERRKTPDSTRA